MIYEPSGNDFRLNFAALVRKLDRLYLLLRVASVFWKKPSVNMEHSYTASIPVTIAGLADIAEIAPLYRFCKLIS